MIIEQLRSVTVVVAMAHCAFIAGAAEPPPQKSAAPGVATPAGEPVSASLGVVVYPAKQQDAAKQSQDEFECYNWAKGSTGYDPMNPPKSEPVVAETPKGGRARGALRGAAAGAAIGEVASNDADKGAEVGAVAGVLHGGQQQRHAQAEAQKQAETQTEEAKKQQLDGFKKGFCACLQGRGYSAVL